MKNSNMKAAVIESGIRNINGKRSALITNNDSAFLRNILTPLRFGKKIEVYKTFHLITTLK
jgi:hypothetical protein